MTWPNQTVEATAPRRLTFVRHYFQNVVVSGGRALTGAVPHLHRYAKAHFFSGVVLMAGERLRVLGFHVLICPGFKTISG